MYKKISKKIIITILSTLFLFGYSGVNFYIITDQLPEGSTGIHYSTQLKHSLENASDTNWILVTGALPPGLSLNQDGWIQGIPTVAGSYLFTVSLSVSVNSTTTTSSGCSDNEASITYNSDGSYTTSSGDGGCSDDTSITYNSDGSYTTSSGNGGCSDDSSTTYDSDDNNNTTTTYDSDDTSSDDGGCSDDASTTYDSDNKISSKIYAKILSQSKGFMIIIN